MWRVMLRPFSPPWELQDNKLSLCHWRVWHSQDVILRDLHHISCPHSWPTIIIGVDGDIHVVLHVLPRILCSLLTRERPVKLSAAQGQQRWSWSTFSLLHSNLVGDLCVGLTAARYPVSDSGIDGFLLQRLPNGCSTLQWLEATPVMLNTVGANGYGTYFIYGCFCFTVGVGAFFLVPETKGVRSSDPASTRCVANLIVADS